MGGNPFYSNAEAYAFEILQQKLMKEAQRSVQQTVTELSALKTLFNHGQFIYCIPFGGAGLSAPFPFSPPLTHLDHTFSPPEALHLPMPPSLPPPAAPPPVAPCLPSPPSVPPCPAPPCAVAPTAQPPVNVQQSVVHVNVKNTQVKPSGKPGSDECNLGDAGIDVTIDLREYLPAEIHLNVEEKSLEIKACHVDAQGSKTFARRYDLPACIILDSVKYVLSHDGYLLFSAAWIKMDSP